MVGCCSGIGNVSVGLVEFFDNGTSLGTTPATGVTQFTTSALTPGDHLITATYLGSGDFCPSSTQGVTHTVTPNYPLAVDVAQRGGLVPPGGPEPGEGGLPDVQAAAAVVVPTAVLAAGVATYRRAHARPPAPG